MPLLNELHIDPPQKTLRLEFVELFNPGTGAVNLADWRLQGGVNYRFPAGTTIPGGGFLVIAENPRSIETNFNVQALGPWTGSLGNEGDTLELKDPAGNPIDRLSYQTGYPWPLVGTDAGYSAQLIHPGLDNDLGGSWRSAPPTPGATNASYATHAPPQTRQVNHDPKAPKSGQAVKITVKVTDPDGVSGVSLQYQVVEPGQYIQLTNPAYATSWTTLAMRDDGTGGDTTAGDNLYTATLDPSVQVHRRMVRYRITTTDRLGESVTVPYPDDPQPNFAYFCYDGVPAWKGASQPGVTPVETFEPAVMESIPPHHLIANSVDVENCQYNSTFNSVPFYGTLVYDGEVYDHIQFSIRGEASTYYSGKNKWRFYFNKGHEFQARDNYGTPYKTRRKKLDLNACASPWIEPNRGMAGIDEAAPHRLFQLAKVPSSNTHWVHYRVIDEAEESSSTNQYRSDLWGLYLAVEHLDGRFLDEHGYPDGNIYEIAGDANKKNQGPTQPVTTVDWDQFSSQAASFPPVSWWRQNMGLDSLYSFHAIDRVTSNVDLRDYANHYYYHHPDGKWHPMPWDLDMMFVPRTHWSAVIAATICLNHAELRMEFRNRCRELIDLLFSDKSIYGGQVAQVVEELASRVNPPGQRLTFVDVDQYMWNYHPRTVERGFAGVYYQNPATETQMIGGLYTRTLVTPDHEGMMQYARDFMTDTDPDGWSVGDGDQRGYGFNYLRFEAQWNDLPGTPVVTYAGAPGYAIHDLRFQTSPFDPGGPTNNTTFTAMQWRLGEISNPAIPGYEPGKPWKFEIEPVWESGVLTTFNDQMRIPSGVLQAGHTYRARVRMKNASGAWSHWSDPFEFRAGQPDFAAYRGTLSLSEIHYHPAGEPGIDGDEFEFLELKNVGPTRLDLGSLYFSQGIEFTFGAGTSLDPGRHLVLVRNPAAFQQRYPGVAIHGTYLGNLANGGDTITLSASIGEPILSVTYSALAPWPVTADKYGFSLVPDDASPVRYRASTNPGGSPGQDDPASTIPRVVINEVTTATTAPQTDEIELFNPLATPASIGGWFLTDDPAVPKKFRIKDSVTLAPGGFTLFTEADFNPSPSTTNNFALSARGEQIYLFSANSAGDLTGYSHGFRFGPAPRGVSFGRTLISTGEERFPLQSSYTPGAVNSGPRVGPVIVSEIQYFPAPGGDEFVELRNISGSPVLLYDPAHRTNTWRLSGLGYSFPTNLSLAPQESLLLVPTDPAAFRARHGIAPEVQIAGPYAGNLQDNGERLELQLPDPADASGANYFAVDEVRYDNHLPWPAAAAGTGASLHRRPESAYGDDPAHWEAAAPSPGSPFAPGTPPRFITLPVPQTVVVSETATFTGEAEGPAPLHYQWRLNGQILAGATNTTLVLTNVQPELDGPYTLTVFNSAGSIESDPVLLTVRSPLRITSQPKDVYVRPGVKVTFSVAAQSSTSIRYQWRFGTTPLPGATNSTLTLLNVNTNEEGSYTAAMTDAVGTVLSRPAKLVLLFNPVITQQPQSQTVLQGDNVTFNVAVTGTVPMGFRWRRNGATVVPFGEGTASLTLTNVKTSQAGSYTVVVTNLANLTPGVLSATAVLTVLADTDGDRIPDTWETLYGLLPNDASDASLDPDRDGMTNLQEYLAGTNPKDASSFLKLEQLSNVPGSPTVNFLAASNKTYTVQFREAAQAGRWTWLADVAAAPSNRVVSVRDPYPMTEQRLYRLITPTQPRPAPGPVILKSPLSQEVTVGTDVAFTTLASSTGPLAYQWLFGGSNVMGATTSSLLLPRVQTNAVGTYAVVLTDALGSVTSAPASLNVLIEPEITAQPQSQTAAAGQDVTFSVVVNGFPPFSYRWFFNQTPVPGAHGPVLVLKNVSGADAGSYRVAVRHQTPFGPAGLMSQPATLNVTP